MTMVSKQIDPSLMRDSSARSILNTLHGSDAPDEKLAFLEAAMLDLALYDLHLYKEDIKEGVEQYEKNHIKKFYRAFTKVNLDRINKGLAPIPQEKALEAFSKARESPSADEAGEMQWIERYTREDGTPVSAHWRTLREGEDQTAKTQRKVDELKRKEQLAQRPTGGARDPGDFSTLDMGSLGIGGPSDKALKRSRWTLDRVLDGSDFAARRDKSFFQAANSFLSERDFTKGVSEVGRYFSNRAGRVGTIARVTREYGPMAGMRMAHAYFRYGGYDVPIRQNARGERFTEFNDKIEDGESKQETREWAKETLRERIPGEQAHAGGAEPPSEGFVIDRDGNTILHAVGRGNDHYVPFSAKHMKRMRQETGHEYVRRRMFGGPTVEDLHAAMATGVDRFTVISNSGDFSMDVSPRAHGLKSEHVQTLVRYENLLRDRNRDFAGYQNALDALEGEFPLHFQVADVQAGEDQWVNERDSAGPLRSFMDEMREVFLAGNDPERARRADRQRQFGPAGIRQPTSEPRDALDLGLSYARRGESIREAYDRRRGHQGNAASQAERAYRNAGREVPRDIRRDAERERGGDPFPVTTTTVRERQSEQGRGADPDVPRATAVPPSDEWFLEQERQQARTPPNQLTSERGSDIPNVTTSRGGNTIAETFSDFDDGVNRLAELDIDPDKPPPTRGRTQFKHVLEDVHNMTQDEWEEYREDPAKTDVLIDSLLDIDDIWNF